MASRAELKRQYKECPRPAGVFKIGNKANGKILLGSSLSLQGRLNSARFKLSAGCHPNAELQADWNRYGPENFTFEIVESVRQSDDPGFNLEDELTLLEEIWLEKLSPLAPRGYNKTARIRK